MLKQDANRSAGTKEEERKQFGKPDNKSESSRFKPTDAKTQQKKADSATKTHGKECSMEEDDEEECEGA